MKVPFIQERERLGDLHINLPDGKGEKGSKSHMLLMESISNFH